jgi:hypothetical protein
LVLAVENCFELFGFDILIDDKLNPWLMKVNFSPSMNTDESPVDHFVKSSVIVDTLNLVGVYNSSVSGSSPAANACTDPMKLAIQQLRRKQPKGLTTTYRPQPNHDKSAVNDAVINTANTLVRSSSPAPLSGRESAGRIPSARSEGTGSSYDLQSKLRHLGMAYNIELKEHHKESLRLSALKTDSKQLLQQLELEKSASEPTVKKRNVKIADTKENDGGIEEEPVKLSRVPSSESTKYSTAGRSSNGNTSTKSKAKTAVQAFVVDPSSRKKSMLRFEGKDTLRPRYDYAETNHFRDTFKQHVEAKAIKDISQSVVGSVILIAMANVLHEVENDLLNAEPSIFWQNEDFIECKHLKSRFPLARASIGGSAKTVQQPLASASASSDSSNERQMLVRTVQELMRSNGGGFHLVFPSADSHLYLPFFEKERLFNVLLSKYFFSLSLCERSDGSNNGPRGTSRGMGRAPRPVSPESPGGSNGNTRLADSPKPFLDVNHLLSKNSLQSSSLSPEPPDPAESYPFMYLDAAPAEKLSYSFDLQFEWRETLRQPYATTVLGYAGAPIPATASAKLAALSSQNSIFLAPRPSSAVATKPTITSASDAGSAFHRARGSRSRCVSAGPLPRTSSDGQGSVSMGAVQDGKNVVDSDVNPIAGDVTTRLSDYLIQSPNDKLRVHASMSPRSLSTPALSNNVGGHVHRAEIGAALGTELNQNHHHRPTAELDLDLSVLDCPVINRKWARALGQRVR